MSRRRVIGACLDELGPGDDRSQEEHHRADAVRNQRMPFKQRGCEYRANDPRKTCQTLGYPNSDTLLIRRSEI